MSPPTEATSSSCIAVVMSPDDALLANAEAIPSDVTGLVLPSVGSESKVRVDCFPCNARYTAALVMQAVLPLVGAVDALVDTATIFPST